MNVLFVSIEDLNDWVEPLGGHPQVITPNIARLAARGCVFETAMSPAPACSPARSAALFGQAPWRTGLYSNAHSWDMAYTAGRHLSLPGAFKAAGWDTFGAGKIFHKAVRGIDPADWTDYLRRAHDSFPPLSRPVKAGDLPPLSDFGAHEDGGNFDEASTDWICARVTPEADGAFWGLGLFRPHLPFIVPQRFFDLYPEEPDLPPGLPGPFDPEDETALAQVPPEARRFGNRGVGRALAEHGSYHAFLRAYLASITCADACLGRVLDRLEETGQADNTLIVLWSDHGWQFGEKLAFRKFTLWERALRVPFIWAGPGVNPGRSAEPVSLLDLYPTLCARAGVVPTQTQLDGLDISGLLSGGQGPARDGVQSVWGNWQRLEDGHIAFSHRSRDYRYTRYWRGGEELYDHSADPFEHRNLLAPGTEPGLNVRAIADDLAAQMRAAIPLLSD